MKPATPVAILALALAGCMDGEHPLAVEPDDVRLDLAPATVEAVDLTAWTAESYEGGAGNWIVATGGSSVTQTLNGLPTLFYSDFDAFKTEVQGVIRVNTTSDDDFIGFALGFRPDDTVSEDADYLLVDWKKGTQTFDFGSPSCTPGTTAEVGLAVSRVFGIPTADELWGHENFDEPACSDLDHGVEELARGNTLHSTGWASHTDYTFAFQFTATLLRVYVDGELELEVAGDFSDGRLAFYNFSQASVQYSAFTVAEFNTAPSADAGGSYAGDEGSPITFDADGSSDPDGDLLTYEWDFGDGNTGSGVDPEHTYADDGEYTVTLTVSDGAATDQAQVVVRIDNVDPSVVEIIAPSAAAVGSEITVTASFTDPGVDDTHTARIFWGDGSDATTATVTESGGSGSLEGSHAYDKAGSYTVTVEVTDKDGGIGTATAEVVVEREGEAPIEDEDLAQLDRSIDDYVVDGSIKHKGTAQSLKSLLKNSDAALQRGNTKAAKNTLGAFKKQVDAQSGKHITEAAAADLGTQAEKRIDEL